MDPMALAAYRFRATIGARWRSYVGAALLLGLTGGLSLFAMAGARRTQSSYPRILRATEASNLSMTGGDLKDADVEAATAAFPEVVQSRTWVAFQANVLVNGRPDFSQNFEPVGTFDGAYFDQDRFTATEGRIPDRRKVGEVAVNEYAAKRFRYGVRQHLDLAIY